MARFSTADRLIQAARDKIAAKTYTSMNIALIMHELLVEGGGERQCVSLARALARQDHQVVVYTSA